MIELSYPSGASNPTLDELKVAIGGSLGVSPSFVDVTVTSTTRRRLLGTVSVTARVSFPTIATAVAAQAKIILVKSLQVNGVSVSVVSVSLLEPEQTTVPSTTPTPTPGTEVKPEVIIGSTVGAVFLVGISVLIFYAVRTAKPKLGKGRVSNNTTKNPKSTPSHANNAQFVFHDPVAVRI